MRKHGGLGIWAVGLVTALVMPACGSVRPGFPDGPVQKRLHRPGWAVDLGRSRPNANVSSAVRAAKPEDVPANAELIAPEAPIEIEASSTDHVAGPPAGPPVTSRTSPAIPALNAGTPHVDHRTTAPEYEQLPGPADEPKGVFNWLAPISLLVALGVPLLGILLENSFLAVGGAVLGFILALIAARTCRDKGRTGGGFALAALIVSTLLLVLTAIGLAV